MQQLEPVFAAKRAVAALDTQVADKQNEINQLVDDQKRVRDNLGALKGSAEERSLAKRYAAELNTQEDTLATLRHDLASLQQQRETAEADLNNRIEALTLDEKLGS
jgi:predicted  nucleic acid-binding Zn-ribbon protein